MALNIKTEDYKRIKSHRIVTQNRSYGKEDRKHETKPHDKSEIKRHKEGRRRGRQRQMKENESKTQEQSSRAADETTRKNGKVIVHCACK